MDNQIFIPDRGRDPLCLYHCNQTISMAHPASYPMNAWESFPRIKQLGHEAHNSPPPSADVKYAWS